MVLSSFIGYEYDGNGVSPWGLVFVVWIRMKVFRSDSVPVRRVSRINKTKCTF